MCQYPPIRHYQRVPSQPAASQVSFGASQSRAPVDRRDCPTQASTALAASAVLCLSLQQVGSFSATAASVAVVVCTFAHMHTRGTLAPHTCAVASSSSARTTFSALPKSARALVVCIPFYLLPLRHPAPSLIVTYRILPCPVSVTSSSFSSWPTPEPREPAITTGGRTLEHRRLGSREVRGRRRKISGQVATEVTGGVS